ncbi:MAG: serine hydrolase [Flavobacteriaceae bacterium]|nr:serine hydrolase [Flavobacteriaceae bacterium]
MQLKFFSFLFLLLCLTDIQAQTDPLITSDKEKQQQWVDSVYTSMTLNEKIGQLFMLPAYSNKNKKHINFVKKQITKYHIGSLIFMQGTPTKQATLTNSYQALSKVPLLIGIDAEWGLNMRLHNTYRFPWNMTLGAVQDNNLITQFGKRVGQECKRLGININFAPVVDVNTNPKNPIIGNRSFGQNPQNVSAKALAFMKGIQSEHILTSAKHFPGHGDTSADSHKTLPTVLHSKAYIDSVDLEPYKVLINKGLTGVMVAHLNVPSLVKTPNLPTSLSHDVVTNLLNKDMGFKGLIFTDALNMKGVANFGKSTTVDLKAFEAGNDVMMFSASVPKAIRKIKKAILKGDISKSRLESSVKKILKAKYWAGLNNYKAIKLTNLQDDLLTVSDEILHRKLVNKSITLVKNEFDLLPVTNLSQKIAYVKLGDASNDTFVETLKKYTRVDVITGKNAAQINTKLQTYDVVIVGLHKSNANPYKSYKFSESELRTLQLIARNNKVILDVFTSPYALLQVKTFTDIESVVVSYQNSKIAQSISAQILFGALQASGKLPVSINDDFEVGQGIVTKNLHRLSYGIPEEVEMSTSQLARIDSMAQAVLSEKMAPGMQVLVARYGKVIFQKSYGFYTDKKHEKVNNNSLYDLASLTKILGALPLVMKAYEEGNFNLKTRLDALFPVLMGSNKDTVTVKEALSHVGRLQAWIPYYLKTIDTVTHQPLAKYYRSVKSKKYSIPVAKNLYLRTDYTDSIYKAIADVPQREEAGYKYSGLVFYLFKKYFEDLYNKPMQTLDAQYFYVPLGALNLGYLPLQKFDSSRIVPTEKDTYYRHQLLRGYVHDMGAAMMGNVSGNAGLFSNANDVAKMMQMYLQKGSYGGKRYFKSKTIDTFNHRYYEKDSVRRGLGFDKPQLDPEVLASCGCVSAQSFGHSGFTGNFAWADPESGIVYVFLSNRVYPTMQNTLLGDKDVRTKTQKIIQEAIIEHGTVPILVKKPN